MVTKTTCSLLVISQGFFFSQCEGRLEINLNSIDLPNKNIIFNATFGYMISIVFIFEFVSFFFNHAELVVIELIMLISLDLFSVRICFRNSELNGVSHVEAISLYSFYQWAIG